MKCSNFVYTALLLLSLSFEAQAQPFTTCPSKAFLIQDSVAKMYGVNLVTGNYSLLASDLGTNGKINGFGFNFHDNYLYGWGYEWGTPVRIGNDLQAQPLDVTNLPDTNFYVGDVALHENAYYVYRGGSQFGLYRIDLDPEHSNYLNAERIADGSSLSLAIFDLAFHPDNGFAYSVDRNGQLFRLDVVSGSASLLGNVGESGTFGAVYFDVNGNFYISRNQDGQVFRIDIESGSPTAELFAYGPSSSNNDGARCAIAPIVDDSQPATTDFGDAPDSYGTSLDNNGARHGVGDLYLGSVIDAEYDAYLYPLSDESSLNDEDGVNFISIFESGLDSLLQVTVNGNGYLSIWVDWDQDGQFSADEQLVHDREMDTGSETFLVETPLDVTTGVTWARVRYSATPGVAATGGVALGEVEDYQVQVLNPGYSLVRNTPFFLAFEDNWPEKGDYDFNDVVIRLDSSLILTSENAVKQLRIEGELKAMGASYHNGFAIRLPGITDDDIDQSLIRFDINGQSFDQVLLESGTNHSVLKISEDLWQHVRPDSSCWFYRTQPGCHSSSTFSFRVTIPFIDAVAYGDFPQAPFDPFIFATPDTFHGDSFAEDPGRGLEIHLKNQAPTALANGSYFGMAEDASDPGAGFYYQTENGLPWGIAINADLSENWHHPLEWVDIIRAYPEFADYATSEGTLNPDWFINSHSVSDKTYQY